jgi:hypothetical protein
LCNTPGQCCYYEYGECIDDLPPHKSTYTSICGGLC